MEGKNLTLKGRITVANSILLSQLYYLSIIIYTQTRALKEIIKLITDYIWEGKQPKIKHALLTQNIEYCG